VAEIAIMTGGHKFLLCLARTPASDGATAVRPWAPRNREARAGVQSRHDADDLAFGTRVRFASQSMPVGHCVRMG